MAVHTAVGVADQQHRVVIIEPSDVDIQVSSETPPVSVGNRGRVHSDSGLQELIAPRALLKVCTSALRTHFSYTDSHLFLDIITSLQEQVSSAFQSTDNVEPNPKDSFTIHGELTRSYFNIFNQKLIIIIFFINVFFPDASIARLMDMGFSVEQAVSELRKAKGHLSAAILHLTSRTYKSASLESPSTSSDVKDMDLEEQSSKAVKWLKQLFSYIAPSISAITVRVFSYLLFYLPAHLTFFVCGFC